MTAMDGASKNAGRLLFFPSQATFFLINGYHLFTGEMIDKLTLAFNRTRQAVITRELIEIISGAACV